MIPKFTMGGHVCKRNNECRIFLWGAYDYVMAGTRPLVVFSKEQHTFFTIHLSNRIQ